MKLYDKVFCILNCVKGRETVFTASNWYYINGVSDSIIYVQNGLDTGAFSTQKEDYNYIFNFFMSEQQIRKEKLKKINSYENMYM